MDETLTHLLISCLTQIMINEKTDEKVIIIDQQIRKDLIATIRIIDDNDESLIKVKINLSEAKNEPTHTRDVPKGYH